MHITLFAAAFAAVASPSAASELPGVDALPAVAELPDPFLMAGGRRVATRADWAKRRREIREIVLHYEYGHPPGAPGNVQAEEVPSAEDLNSAATHRRVLLSCGPRHAVRFALDVFIPKAGHGPFPVMLTGDGCWGPVEVAEEIVRRGYILAQFDRTQLDGDNADRSDGVHPLYPEHDWGTLAAWAWGYSRAVDYLVTRKDVDARRIAATGHSRGGKTALLASALDERIALVAPNGSGCGGAGSYRWLGKGSEDMAAILKNFPYWFHPRLAEFVGRVNRMPLDQHFLMALVAPRPLLSTNALGDLWANPEGSQQVYLAAKQVYQFLGARDFIGIHFREGEHAQNAEDWRALLDFADRQFFGKEVARRSDALAFPALPKAFSWTRPR